MSGTGNKLSGGESAPPIAFLDFEASGLGAGSWPVEIGWAFESGACESHLIKPVSDWPMSAWDPKAEKMHGIPYERLLAQGEDINSVCKRLNATLGNALIYSDAPDWDSYWLYRLFGASPLKPAFRLRDYGRLMRPLVAGRESALFAEADRLAPRTHRAAADALHLQTLYRLAKGQPA